jgi:hypothetical protein
MRCRIGNEKHPPCELADLPCCLNSNCTTTDN